MIIKRYSGLQAYSTLWQEMKTFTTNRDADTTDEIWLLEHAPVYTQGQAGKAEHLLYPTQIPVVHSDRGGQITYHGPGQLIIYVLMDLQRRKLGVRTLVKQLEELLIDVLAQFGIQAKQKTGAPGVYVADKKIASIGLRIKGGCSYHGIALNVNMDLKPFEDINPCGFKHLKMAQMSDYIIDIHLHDVVPFIEKAFTNSFGC